QSSDLAKLRGVFRPHGGGDPRYAAEEIREHGHVVAGRMLEQQRRPAGAQHAIADLGHLQARRHRRSDAPELAARLELSEELAQIPVGHRVAAISRSLAISAKSSSSVSRPRTQ